MAFSPIAPVVLGELEHLLRRIDRKLSLNNRLIRRLLAQGDHAMPSIEEIEALLARSVEETVTVEGSAEVLIQNISDALKAAVNVPPVLPDAAALQAIIDRLDAGSASLAAKVAANTLPAPAAPDAAPSETTAADTAVTPAAGDAAGSADAGGAQAAEGFKSTQT